MSGSDIILQALQSEDTKDQTRLEVRADVQTEGRKDTQLEQLVARLSLESSVSSVRWEVVSAETTGTSSLFNGNAKVSNTAAMEEAIE